MATEPLFKPSLFRSLAASNQYAHQVFSTKSHHILSNASTTTDVTSVSLLEPSSTVPRVFGSHSWLPPATTRDAEYAVKLYTNATDSLVNALRVTPSQAVFNGTISTQGIFLRDWRLLQDATTGDMLLQKFDTLLNAYVTKTRFSS